MFGYPTSARRLLADAFNGATLQRSVWLALAITLAVASAALAQTVAVAHLSGTVTDESGAAIPGVDVNVIQTDTGFTRSVITDERGEYSLPSLPVGPYKLTATLPGFSTFEQSGILLRVGDTRRSMWH
jgi:Carboxypeptidase regulatory-like domain